MKEKYSSIGKEYNNEKGIISLTSWKARVKTVPQTLFSLLKSCQGFHIVLVLSEEEFPNKENDLPKELMFMVNKQLIEILWVYKNYKAFKKVLFTMDKYRNVPVISADDDCIYICNYAEELYKNWLKTQDTIIRYTCNNTTDWYLAVSGPGTLYTWNNFGKYAFNCLQFLDEEDVKKSLDDNFYNEVIFCFDLKFKGLNKGKYFIVYNEIDALHSNAWWKTGKPQPPRKFHYLNKILKYKESIKPIQ